MALERLRGTITRTDFERKFNRLDKVTLTGLQAETAYEGLCKQFQRPHDTNRVFSEDSVIVNDTEHIITSLVAHEFSPKNIKLDLTTAKNLRSPRTPKPFLYAYFRLLSEGKVQEIDNLLGNGAAILTMRRTKLDLTTLEQFDYVADQIHGTSDWALQSFMQKAEEPNNPEISVIPEDAGDRNHLMHIEQQIFEDINTSIVFQVLPKDEDQKKQIEELKLNDTLNIAVNPLEKVWIAQLIDQEIIQHELRKVAIVALPLLCVSGGIGVLEFLGQGFWAKLLLFNGSDAAEAGEHAVVAHERFNQPLSYALASRAYDVVPNMVQAIPAAYYMNDMVQQGHFTETVAIYAFSVLVSAALSYIATGISGSKEESSKNIMQTDDPAKQTRISIQQGLRLPAKEEMRNFIPSIVRYWKNPAGSGPALGAALSVLLMEGANVSKILRVPGGRALVEAIANFGEVAGVLSSAFLKQLDDELKYIQTANAMIASVKNNSNKSH